MARPLAPHIIRQLVTRRFRPATLSERRLLVVPLLHIGAEEANDEARTTALGRVTAVTVLSFACAPAADDMQQEPSQAEPEVIVGGLNGPMGILVEPDGTIWVVDSGVGGDQVVATPDPGSREMAEASFGETSRIDR